MTRLEEQFSKAFENRGGSAKEMREINARIAAKIALELAFKALKAGNRYQEDMGEELQERAFKQFIQDYE